MTLIRALRALRAFQKAVDWLRLPPTNGLYVGPLPRGLSALRGTIPRLRLQGTMERQEKYRSEASCLASVLQPLASSFDRRLFHAFVPLRRYW